jgi:hypothetical protein
MADPTSGALTTPVQIQPYQTSGALSTPRDVQEKETVAGQMKGLMSQESPYTTMARTRAAEAANTRGLLNTSMGVQAGEAAAIESALPIAQHDATTYSTAAQAAQEYGHRGALSAQESAQTMAQDVNKGEITKDLTSQEYRLKTELMEREYQQKGLLASQDHQQLMSRTQYEWSQKFGLSAQEANQSMNQMVREYALKTGLTQYEAELEISRMQQQYTLEEFRAVQDDLRNQRVIRLNNELETNLAREKAKWDFTLREMVERNNFDIATLQDQGQTTRANAEIALRTYLQDESILSSDRQFAMSMMTSFGDQLQAAITNISVSNLDSASKMSAILNAIDMYHMMSSTTAQITRMNISWEPQPVRGIGGGSGGTTTTTGGSGGSTGGEIEGRTPFYTPPPANTNTSTTGGTTTGGGSGTIDTRDPALEAMAQALKVSVSDITGANKDANVNHYLNVMTDKQREAMAKEKGMTVEQLTALVRSL